MSVARGGVATAVLNGKFYAIGGQDEASVEVYDPSSESWSAGVSLPSEVKPRSCDYDQWNDLFDWWSKCI